MADRMKFPSEMTPKELFAAGVSKDEDPTMDGHYRKKSSELKPGEPERCVNPKCSWTSEHPVPQGVRQDAGNSWYHYHIVMGLR